MHEQHSANGQKVEKERRHACPTPPLRGESASSPKSFSKDGRKIDIGDCALFQAGNAPPFIGILRKVTVDKDQSVRLRVNWLYRPADLKLAKGVPTDAEPNEIFYSFHKDDTPAASLLHPCKVAFLRRGVELPSGVSSFVCRRVYDIANKRLWWLTDRDYTDEHQEEVDQLLNRTKSEMQAAVQAGAPSPRALALPHAEAPATGKGKKRERSDGVHETNSSKRSKVDDSESSFAKPERSLAKSEEIAGIVDKDGGLLNLGCVEKLVNLMVQDRNDGSRQPVEVASRRIMFAGVVAATEKQECRDRIVQLGGLKVLDDWLQEAHKGKGGDGGSPAEGDKISEELLLTVLRALQKLPVDLDALKTCNVGKSVNNLKSHKNMDIHKRARKLVDTWKKRVDAEVKSGEKPGTPGKQDSVHCGRDAKSTGSRNGGASDAPAKPVGSGSSRSATAAGSKESSPNNSASNEVQGASTKEEKSSASQSHNLGSAWSSGSKDDVKGSKASPAGRSKGDHKDSGSGKSNLCRTMSSTGAERPVEKATVDATAGTPGRNKGAAEEGPANQRLILRIPNPGKSPARAAVESQGPAKHSSPKRLDSAEPKSKLSEAPSEKRQKSEGKNGSSVEPRQGGKAAARDNHGTTTAGQTPVVDGGMSLLATVAADEILRCDASTGSTVRSVVTEEGNEENMSSGQDQAPDQTAKESAADKGEKVSDVVKGQETGGVEAPEPIAQVEAAPAMVEAEAEQEALEKPLAAVEASADDAPPSGDGHKEQLPIPSGEPKVDERPLEKLAGVEQPEAPSFMEQESSVSGAGNRPLFDLNEGFPSEESPDAVQGPPPQSVSPVTAPIPVMASTHGTFIPPASPLKTSTEIGWKGSAATSAFRPAEPRMHLDKKAKPAFQFDLNVAEDDGGGSQFDTVRTFLPSSSSAQAAEKVALDLNQVDESESLRFRPLPMGLNPGNVLRNFDLNDGPAYEDQGGAGGSDDSLRSKPKAAVSMMGGGNLSGELLNLSSWYPGGIGIPSFSAAPRSEPAGYSISAAAPHPFISSAAGGGANPFASDIYRAGGGASTSSLGYQANPGGGVYSYAAYPGFPFTSSSTFVNPVAQQQYVGSGSFPGITTHPGASAFSRPPYMLGIPDGGSSAGGGGGAGGTGLDSAGWGRRSLDLNTGPDAPTAAAQAQAQAAAAAAAVAASMESEARQQQQAYVLPLEDHQMRSLNQSGGGGGSGGAGKRKEPDSTWDAYRKGLKWRL